MKIGVLKEIKDHEYRVGLTPSGVQALVNSGHQVFVEKDAGLESGFTNDEYIKEGAIVLDNLEQIWESDIVVKVKEPLKSEYKYFRPGLILFTYLHLAAN